MSEEHPKETDELSEDLKTMAAVFLAQLLAYGLFYQSTLLQHFQLSAFAPGTWHDYLSASFSQPLLVLTAILVDIAWYIMISRPHREHLSRSLRQQVEALGLEPSKPQAIGNKEHDSARTTSLEEGQKHKPGSENPQPSTEKAESKSAKPANRQPHKTLKKQFQKVWAAPTRGCQRNCWSDSTQLYLALTHFF